MTRVDRVVLVQVNLKVINDVAGVQSGSGRERERGGEGDLERC